MASVTGHEPRERAEVPGEDGRVHEGATAPDLDDAALTETHRGTCLARRFGRAHARRLERAAERLRKRYDDEELPE